MHSDHLYGVSTTRIFCRFGCPSRQPRPANVVFFSSVDGALRGGFRPWKRCRPDHERSPVAAFSDFVCTQLLALGRARPDGSIHEIADQLSIPERQLERIVLRATHQSPRAFLSSSLSEHP